MSTTNISDCVIPELFEQYNLYSIPIIDPQYKLDSCKKDIKKIKKLIKKSKCYEKRLFKRCKLLLKLRLIELKKEKEEYDNTFHINSGIAVNCEKLNKEL